MPLRDYSVDKNAPDRFPVLREPGDRDGKSQGAASAANTGNNRNEANCLGCIRRTSVCGGVLTPHGHPEPRKEAPAARTRGRVVSLGDRLAQPRKGGAGHLAKGLNSSGTTRRANAQLHLYRGKGPTPAGESARSPPSH